MDKVILPLETNPWIQAYQMRNFEIGLLQDKQPWIYNKYINIYHSSSNFNLFEHVLNEERWFLREGVTIVQKFRYNKLIFDLQIIDFLEFARNMLKSGYYIAGYFDEFYIKVKSSYQSLHFRHSMFIYGYNDNLNVIYAIGYTAEKKYLPFNISYDEFINAIYSRFDRNKENYFKTDIDKIEFDAVKINPNYFFQLNIKEIYIGLYDYVNSQNSKNKKHNGFIYGINCEKYFIKYIEGFIVNQDDLDVRYSRFFMEMKEIMRKRLYYMEDVGFISGGIAHEYKIIADSQKNIHNLFIKYNLSKNKNLLPRIITIIDNIIENEVITLNKVINELFEYQKNMNREDYL